MKLHIKEQTEGIEMKSMTDHINGLGLTVGVIAWFGLQMFIHSEMSCVYHYPGLPECGSGDLLYAAIFGVGMLPPCFFLAFIVSDMRL